MTTEPAEAAPVEQLVCHPRLPLVAGLDPLRPAVHVWDLSSGEPRRIAAIDADAAPYEGPMRWERETDPPSVSWHPSEPSLVLTGAGGLRRWSPDGITTVAGPPAGAGYQTVAFSPDGRTVWATPASGGVGWGRSDAIDLASGTLRTGPGWDTGVAEHPGGGLIATFESDQSATLGLFARVDDGVPAAMRVLRRALILDVDGYETPMFSPDGRYLAVRGNAYEHVVLVFEFPSLRRVLATTLDGPSPGFPYPQEWLDRHHSWSHHNVAFAARRPGVLLVGTPDGTVIELDVATRQAVEHDLPGRGPVTALAVTADGDLVVARGSGDPALLAMPDSTAATAAPDSTAATAAPDSTAATAVDPRAARERVVSFLEGTSELPDDGSLDGTNLFEALTLTDGSETWSGDDLTTVTTAGTTDPTWLRLQTARNALTLRSD